MVEERILEPLDRLPDIGLGSFAHALEREARHDFVRIKPLQRIAEILGLNLKTRTVRLMGGGTRQEPCIWFRGFWSQGDGACFETFYSYRKHAPRLIREYAPQDADRVAVVQAIGRGIGRAAVHEFVHQLLPRLNIHDSKDDRSYEYGYSSRPAQYYGDMRWDLARPALLERFGNVQKHQDTR